MERDLRGLSERFQIVGADVVAFVFGKSKDEERALFAL